MWNLSLKHFLDLLRLHCSIHKECVQFVISVVFRLFLLRESLSHSGSTILSMRCLLLKIQRLLNNIVVQALDGQNIYNGCCTLRIDFSKLSSLTVKFNNEKTR